ncbi:Sporulation related domain-containing protein [Prevotella sp. tc2-28]|uniref:SPOR domain-containing protein n=1 Tax=Prevotella sp. tc2-28 TaxID=1761888 RepID=UPI00089C3759|nr:SPOR domain-containing protein [Prevotella sp. tc2-28]SDZ95504.1 Sporulation related domain-containing protein [Prevotella sp. tc2-28]
MRQLISILTLCIGISLNADAQTFTQRIQKRVAGQGSVTIHQDSVIDQLVNTTPLGIKTSTQTNKPSQPSSTSQTSPTSQANKTTPTNSYSQPIASIPDTVDTSKKIIRGYKINGYRVQAFAGGNSRADRQKAERIGNDIKSHYTNVPVYVHFYSPRWICRVGNYRTYEEAHQMLVSLRNMGYSQATIVKGKITVQY